MASKYSAEWWRRFELMSAESMGGYDRQSEARSKLQQQQSRNCATDDSGRTDRCIRDSTRAAAVVAE